MLACTKSLSLTQPFLYSYTHCFSGYQTSKMNCELNVSPPQTSVTAGTLFEASTQTPTSEQCDSPLFTEKGYCLKTAGHSNSALRNMYKMKQNGQVRICQKIDFTENWFSVKITCDLKLCCSKDE